jgi:hypothetical protein
MELTELVNRCWKELALEVMGNRVMIIRSSVDLIVGCVDPGQTGRIIAHLNQAKLTNADQRNAGVRLLRWCCDHNNEFRWNFVGNLSFVFGALVPSTDLREKVYDILGDCLLQLRDIERVEAILNYPRETVIEHRIEWFLAAFSSKSGDFSWIEPLIQTCLTTNLAGSPMKVRFCNHFLLKMSNEFKQDIARSNLVQLRNLSREVRSSLEVTRHAAEKPSIPIIA